MQRKMLCTLGTIVGQKQGRNKLTYAPPLPAGQQGNNNILQCPKKDGYVDFLSGVLRNLYADTTAYRKLQICLAN
jgi:hypothetical protein